MFLLLNFVLAKSLAPADHRIRRVGSFEELVSSKFKHGINAFFWERELDGDFEELVRSLTSDAPVTGVSPVDESALLKHAVENGTTRAAAAAIVRDLESLRGIGYEPEMNFVSNYPREIDEIPVPTDVYSFHVDSAPFETDTFLCTYYGATSEGLSVDHAIRRVDQPATRAALLEMFGGADGEGFEQYLEDNCYDLHYLPKIKASPYSFGVGCLWRLAVKYPGCRVPPFVHRAPSTKNHPIGTLPRLLLIS